jgi:hypothetical protein
VTIDLKEIVTLAAAVAGGSFALWRWTVDQKWRRAQYAQSLIKEFFDKKSVAKACEIIDTIGEIEFEIEGNPKRRRIIDVTDELLVQSLTTFDQKEENTDEEIAIRDVLDEFFGGLSVFQSHIDTGLIKLQDVRPYLEYWIKELSGHGNVHGKEVAQQVGRFLQYFGYDRVLLFASDMGYPFEEGEPPPAKPTFGRRAPRTRKPKASRSEANKPRNRGSKKPKRKSRS